MKIGKTLLELTYKQEVKLPVNAKPICVKLVGKQTIYVYYEFNVTHNFYRETKTFFILNCYDHRDVASGAEYLDTCINANEYAYHVYWFPNEV